MHRRDGSLIVSATDLVGFLDCGHLTLLERAAAAGKIRKPIRDDPEIDLLRRRGGEHEKRYIELLEAEGRLITRLDSERVEGEPWQPYEHRAADTLAAMRRGDDVIYQATVFDPPWVGHPDFLLRKPSVKEAGTGGELGRDFSYEVADTKLAHSAKASALIQICSYVEQVTRIQGVEPEHVYVVTGGAKATPRVFRTAELMAYYRRAKAHFETALDEAVAGEPVYPIARELSYPDPVEHCSVCRWFVDYCRRQWRDDDALPLVAGISRSQRKLLTDNEVSTVAALALLEPPIELGTTRSQRESLLNIREQARVQVESRVRDVPKYEFLEPETDSDGKYVPDRGLAALPEPSFGDLFFDIEGDPFAFWEGLDYLFGVWGADDRWQSFWALNRDEEKLAFEQVIDLFTEQWRRDPNMHIYHYASYEPTALKRLAGRHGTREDEVDDLLRGRVLVDLYRAVRQGLRAGVESYSIKRLEPMYGYVRTVELRDANSSIVEFEQILEIGDPDGAIKDLIEAYNRDDCVSARALRDWLETLRGEAGAKFGAELPRPPAPIPEPAGTVRPDEIVLRDLEERLTRHLPSAAERRPEEQAIWLLAQLLDWHARERKASWWRFFELMSLAPDELLGEKEPIAGLVWQGIVGQTARGNEIHRYHFPVQEHDVSGESRLHDPAKPAFEGSGIGGHKIDAANLKLDITRPPDWRGTHPQALVPDNIVWTKAQEEALLRVGRWVAENGIDSPSPVYRAARDLLLRHVPRAGQPDGENLVRSGSGETGTAAARRLAMSLDATTLPIQGPPGSGKTYTGARMILDLVRAGRRVGITSNSHKVIGNLLRAVCDAAAEAGYPLRAMQKGDKDEVITHPLLEVRRAAENSHVEKALTEREVDVVAGTPWLWARQEMEGQVDTLFIDEAGQVSLANVVAVSGCARNVVLLGDPQQLDQPTQGVHPDGAGRSALAHLLDGAEVIAAQKGIFLEKTWRMHPAITAYTSDLFYEGELQPVSGLDAQRVLADGVLTGSGLRWVPVVHEGNTDGSPEEADRVCEIWNSLVGRQWVDERGRARAITADDVVIVAPFNAHRRLIQARLPDARVGTVDKFQGQEAPVSIYTMATSRPEDAPRGLGFLYSLNRLNVATSRARALAIVVASPALLTAVPKTPDQLRMVNGLCAFVERAA